MGLAGSGAGGLWALWAGDALTPDQAMGGLAELNVYYRILRDQGVPFPFASPGPFGALLQALGLTLALGWGAATLCWARGWRRSAFVSLLAVAAVITARRPLGAVDGRGADAGPGDALPPPGVREVGRYDSRGLYSNR